MKTIFTNGCFDLLHPGHVYFLQAAAMLGDRLFVGLNSDASIAKIKGRGRPIIPETHRANMLKELISVSRVIIFDEETPLRLIKELKPDVLVKGNGVDAHWIVGAEEVKSWGGEVIVIPKLEQWSTTNLCEKLDL